MQEECFPRFLNDDSWKYVLDYVPLQDIMSVSQVCRGWEAIVETYFQGVPLRIETITNIWHEDEESRLRKCRILVIEDNNVLFNAVLSKWGNFVMELVYDARLANEDVLWDLGVKCPNIQNISISDDCVGELIKNNNIEELVIRMVDSVTGSFLAQNGGDLSNLKTLILFRCCGFRQLLSAVEPVNYLSGVKKLDLRELSNGVHARAHLILDKMPQLEHLTLDCARRYANEELIQSIRRLGHLRHLGWLDGVVLRGCELEAGLNDGSYLMRPGTRLNRYREPYWKWRNYRLVLYRRQHPNIKMRCGNYLLGPQ